MRADREDHKAATSRVEAMVEGEIWDGIGRGCSHCRCKKGELNKQMNPFILQKVCILG